ncbi:MAG: hypothetical protein LBL91_06240 [Lachnospiraceae bacterium]|jgi:hypothetical protein|nr:hypothetical protein [Lachnospiraceae bacterium]
MKLKCKGIGKGTVTDKYTKKIYENGKIYEVEDGRGKELLASGFFEEVLEERTDETKPVKILPKKSKKVE